MNTQCIQALAGHYGSGKTEIAVNFALALRRAGGQVALADLDIVNPYFRSREQAELLTSKGIEVFASLLREDSADLPALSGAVFSLKDRIKQKIVLDLGGNPEGARAVAGFRNHIKEAGFEMFLVINGNRPQTRKPDQVLYFLDSIQNSVGLPFTGLINNTHMLNETTIDDVLKGHELCMAVSERCDLPLRYNAVPSFLAERMVQEIAGQVLPLFLYMREQWMG